MPVAATIYDQSYKKVSKIDLPDSIFALPPKSYVVYEVVKQQLANRRSGTHSTKRKGEVSGGGIKPFRQKGTGNARQGSIRSPLLVGGGVTFGPSPRDYFYLEPRKKRWKANCVLLSQRSKENKLHIVDELEIKDGKTKNLLAVLKKFKVSSCLIIDNDNEFLKRSARNLKDVKYVGTAGLNPYDIIRREDLIITKKALDSLIEREKGL